MLLEVIEKLLALLIIMAMLILVMFLALPDSRSPTRADIEPAPRERVAEQAEPPVPDPHAAPQTQPQTAPAPTTEITKAPKQDSMPPAVKTAQARPKSPDRLPVAKAEPVPAQRLAKERVKVRTETVIMRQPVATRYAEYRTPDRSQETRVYAQPAQRRTRWDRTHYYECYGGRCDCTCSQPYWARSGPCWD